VTLVLGSVNSDAAVIVADCLLSWQKRPFDDEVTKIALVTFEDARLAMGFTGLAGLGLTKAQRGPAPAGTFRTIEWICDTLADVGPASGQMLPSLSALRERMTADFPPLPVHMAHQMLALGFVGYRYEGSKAIKVAATISNVSDQGGQFVVSREFELCSEDVAGASLLALGVHRALVEAARKQLADLISDRRPPHAIAEKATEVIRQAARQRKAGGAVGDLCMSLVVPSNPASPAVSRHHADRVSGVAFLPRSISLTRDGGVITLDPSIRGGLPGDVPSPIVFPKVPKNAPCPCGSGRKYKRCHGRTSRLKRRPGIA
jgi:hypothetical protein